MNVQMMLRNGLWFKSSCGIQSGPELYCSLVITAMLELNFAKLRGVFRFLFICLTY